MREAVSSWIGQAGFRQIEPEVPTLNVFETLVISRGGRVRMLPEME